MTTIASPFAPGAPVGASFPIQQAETQAVQAALEALPLEGPARTALARNASFMLARCLDYPAEAERLYHLLNEDGAVFEYRELRSRLIDLSELCAARAAILRRLSATLENVADPGAEKPSRLAEAVPAAERLDQLQVRVRAFLAWLDRPRPPVDQNMVQDSRAALARGEYEDVQDVLRRLRDGGPLHEG